MSFFSLLTTPTDPPSMYVNISSGSFWYDTTSIFYPGGISPEIQHGFSDERWVIVAINNKNNIIIIYGEEIDNPRLPIFPLDLIPIAAIYIPTNCNKITSVLIHDIRPFLEITSEDNISNQLINVYKNGDFVATTPTLNFKDGIGTAITAIEDISNNQTKVYVNIQEGDVNNLEHSGNTVSDGTQFHLSPYVGGGFSWARYNHKHGTPPDPIPSHLSTYDHSLLHSSPYEPLPNQKEALIGSHGDPSTFNKYITRNDNRTILTQITIIANRTIEAYKIINLDQSHSEITNITSILGMTLNYGNVGDSIVVQLWGIVINPEWNLETFKGVFLTDEGDFIQDVHPGDVILSIGVPINSTTLFFRVYNSNIKTTTLAPITTTTVSPTTTTTTVDIDIIMNINATP